MCHTAKERLDARLVFPIFCQEQVVECVICKSAMQISRDRSAIAAGKDMLERYVHTGVEYNRDGGDDPIIAPCWDQRGSLIATGLPLCSRMVVM